MLIVDPSLPPSILGARLSERSPVQPSQVSHVFLTSATDEHMRGLAAFPDAQWLAFETEIAAARAATHEDLSLALEHPEDGGVEPLEHRLAMLDRLRPAEDTIAQGVDLFPLAGATPGCCGILVSQPTRTVLIAGDAVASREHVADAQVLPHCWNREAAQSSFAEAIEIADVIVPGRDNILLNPTRAR
jgi:glyoxylase-like metal-dependent hydrolase (beta-lactamase superfamily II)